MKGRKVGDLAGFLISEVQGRIARSSFSAVAAESGVDRATLHRLSHDDMPKLTLRTAIKVAAYLGGELRFVKNGRAR
jgi:DNA-binding phage protein